MPQSLAEIARLAEKIELPSLDQEPDYLETGLWHREFKRAETTHAQNLNKTIQIDSNVICFVDPITGIEQMFSITNDLRNALQRISRNPDAVGTFPSNLRERLAALGVLVENDQQVSRRRRAWHNLLERARRQFRRDGYVKFPRLLCPVHLAWLRHRYRRLAREAEFEYGDPQCRTRWVAHNEPAARVFHPLLRGIVSHVAAVKVKPSYLYLGCYQAGSILPEHVDRAQCEFSITMLVDYMPELDGKSPWPIYLRTSHGVVPVRQQIGDALIYRGRRLPHFRKALPAGNMSSSIFFHFVPDHFADTLN
jgi:hypothetical protein